MKETLSEAYKEFKFIHFHDFRLVIADGTVALDIFIGFMMLSLSCNGIVKFCSSKPSSGG
jgi:hypothetical protein